MGWGIWGVMGLFGARNSGSLQDSGGAQLHKASLFNLSLSQMIFGVTMGKCNLAVAYLVQRMALVGVQSERFFGQESLGHEP